MTQQSSLHKNKKFGDDFKHDQVYKSDNISVHEAKITTFESL